MFRSSIYPKSPFQSQASLSQSYLGLVSLFPIRSNVFLLFMVLVALTQQSHPVYGGGGSHSARSL